MIVLYQFPKIGQLPNMSPFCMKLESYLRAMNLPYKLHETFDIRKSPTGKLPYIETQGNRLPDSGLIIARLEASQKEPMQAHLSNVEQAVSLAFIRLMEEHLYWAIVYARWIDPVGLPIWTDQLRQTMGLSKFAFKLILSGIKRNIIKSLDGHGLGRHKQTDITTLAKEDIKALADFLGGRDFCFGDKPTLMDHSLYSFVASIITVGWDYPLKGLTLRCQNLIDHYRRMMTLFYPEVSIEI